MLYLKIVTWWDSDPNIQEIRYFSCFGQYFKSFVFSFVLFTVIIVLILTTPLFLAVRRLFPKAYSFKVQRFHKDGNLCHSCCQIFFLFLDYLQFYKKIFSLPNRPSPHSQHYSSSLSLTCWTFSHVNEVRRLHMHSHS